MKFTEFLVDFLPEYQRPFAKGESFRFLCECVEQFFSTYAEENKQVLALAMQNFDHYCKSHPDYQRVVLEIQEKKRIREREEYLNRLYQQQKGLT